MNDFASEFPLQGYIARTGTGVKSSFEKLQSIRNFPAEQQLLAACLSGNIASAQQLLPAVDTDIFTQLVFEESLSALVLDQLHETMLGAEFERAAAGRHMMAAIQQQTKLAAANYSYIDNLFLQLLDNVFANIPEQVMFLKGTALARTLYRRPHTRLSSDFDVLVHSSHIGGAIQMLEQASFNRIFDPGVCQTVGAAPVDSATQLLLTPGGNFLPCDVLAYQRPQWPIVELKLDPLELGLRAVEYDRFFEDALVIDYAGRKFRAPNNIDHLIIISSHLQKSGFRSWRLIYDAHLLAKSLSSDQWTELVRRSRVEGLDGTVWATLELVADRLTSRAGYAEEEIEKLRPNSQLSKFLAYALEPRFSWNQQSLPTLLLSATFGSRSGDKWQALRDIVLPSRQFLTDYYNEGQPANVLQRLCFLFLYWLNVLLPAGMVRRLFGKFMWKQSAAK